MTDHDVFVAHRVRLEMTIQSNNPRPARYLVYICDDEGDMISRFKEKQDGYMDIKAFTRIKDLQDACLEREPDLILLDLFWQKENIPDDTVKLADTRLSDFQKQIPELRNAIYTAYSPLGVGGLKDLRSELPTTPIMIHSKTGQLLLTAQDIKEVVSADAGWLPKNQENVTAEVETRAIEQFVKSKKRLNSAPQKAIEECAQLRDQIAELNNTITSLSDKNRSLEISSDEQSREIDALAARVHFLLRGRRGIVWLAVLSFSAFLICLFVLIFPYISALAGNQWITIGAIILAFLSAVGTFFGAVEKVLSFAKFVKK